MYPAVPPPPKVVVPELPFSQQGPPTPWTTGLCDCNEDCKLCCLAYWCPCIVFGQIAEILDNGSTSCLQAGLTYYALMHVACTSCYTCTYRKKMRLKFNLETKPCADYCVHRYCESCAMAQEYRELKRRGFDPALGWAVSVERMRTGQAGIAMTVPPEGQAMNRNS